MNSEKGRPRIIISYKMRRVSTTIETILQAIQGHRVPQPVEEMGVEVTIEVIVYQEMMMSAVINKTEQ